MVDKACSDVLEAEIKEIISKQQGVEGIDDFKTRQFGSKIFVDVEIEADGSQTLEEAHVIAEHVHFAVEHSFNDVKHCMVHVNPTKTK